MSDLKLSGKLIAVSETQQVTDSFSKREFVIETDEQYPQQVKFELIQAKCSDLDHHNIGELLIVHFNVRGRKWQNKQGEDVYFVSLNAWRLESAGSSQDAPQDAAPDIPSPSDSFPNDLPF